MDTTTVAAGALGGTAMYFGAGSVLRSQTANDLASTAGSLYGGKFSKLPVVPEFVAAYKGRQIARSFIDSHAPNTHPLVRGWVIDGVAPRLASELNDPNQVAAAVGNRARALADLGADAIARRWPSAGDSAAQIVDQASQLSATAARLAAETANGAMGAHVGRGLLQGARIGAAALGVAAGAALLRPVISGAGSAIGGAASWIASPFHEPTDFERRQARSNMPREQFAFEMALRLSSYTSDRLMLENLMRGSKLSNDDLDILVGRAETVGNSGNDEVELFAAMLRSGHSRDEILTRMDAGLAEIKETMKTRNVPDEEGLQIYKQHLNG